MTKDMVYFSGKQHIIEVPVQELRDIFNALEIARKGRQRILKRERVWSGKRRPRHLHTGSRSVTWHYRLPHNNWLLAVAHVYLERGGQVVGQPDPKEIRIDELVLKPMNSDYGG